MFRFALGLFIGLSLATAAAEGVRVATSGVLEGYVVQNQDGIEICKDPVAYNNFQGMGVDYIVCEGE
jgi:hypothetical protein